MILVDSLPSRRSFAVTVFSPSPSPPRRPTIAFVITSSSRSCSGSRRRPSPPWSSTTTLLIAVTMAAALVLRRRFRRRRLQCEYEHLLINEDFDNGLRHMDKALPYGESIYTQERVQKWLRGVSDYRGYYSADVVKVLDVGDRRGGGEGEGVAKLQGLGGRVTVGERRGMVRALDVGEGRAVRERGHVVRAQGVGGRGIVGERGGVVKMRGVGERGYRCEGVVKGWKPYVPKMPLGAAAAM